MILQAWREIFDYTGYYNDIRGCLIILQGSPKYYGAYTFTPDTDAGGYYTPRLPVLRKLQNPLESSDFSLMDPVCHRFDTLVKRRF